MINTSAFNTCELLLTIPFNQIARDGWRVTRLVKHFHIGSTLSPSINEKVVGIAYIW
jgi:hypothetical protein